MGRWPAVRLGDACSIAKQKHDGAELAYVGMEHIESGTGRLTSEPSSARMKSSTFSFDETHVLYGRLRPYLNKVLLPDFKGHCSTEIFPLQCGPKLDRRFLFYWLTSESTVAAIDRTSTGTRMPRANVSALLDLRVPLPPRGEQERIVAILDEAFAAIAPATANAEKSLANARELFESKLNCVFSCSGNGWEEKPLSSLATHSLGKMLDRQKNRGVLRPYLRNLNVRWFSVDLTDVLEMRFEESEYDKYTAEVGDLLICEGGYPGRAAIWSGPQPVHFQKAIHRVRFHDPCYTKWFLYLLYHLDASGGIRQYFTGTGIQHVTGKSLARVRVPYPPTEEVSAHVARFEALRAETERLSSVYKRKQELLSELKQSILHKAFAGELTADPKAADRTLSEGGA